MKKLSDIFDIKNSKSLELINCEEDIWGVPFISRTSEMNGMVARVKILDEVDPMEWHAITVALGGSVLWSFYQSEPFYTSFHIACLYPKYQFSNQEMLYYCTIIEANKYRYSYGRQANKTLKDILVPSPEEIPASVKNYNLDDKFIKKPVSDKKLTLDTKSWKWFRYDEIFDIQKWKRLTKADMIDGNIKYIWATDSNNGITAFIWNEEQIHSGNTITVSYNWSIGNAFYQESEFWATDDVNVLYPKFLLNKYIGCLLITLIEKEKYRFSYWNKWDKETMRASKIKLPITSTWSPDWQWMEEYIKGLSYSAAL
jgi:Type I restriction modification DNA specificity domain